MQKILFLMNAKGLMDRDLIYALKKAGHEVLVDQITTARTPEGHQAELISSEHFIEALEGFRPGMVFSFNGRGVDNEGFCASEMHKRGIPFVTWYVDQPRPSSMGKRYRADNTWIFCFERHFVPQLKDWGFGQAFYLPLATNPDRFRPLGLEAEPSVCFVGDSDYARIDYLARNLDRQLGKLGDVFYDVLDRAINLLLGRPGCPAGPLVQAAVREAPFTWEGLTTDQQDMLEGFVEREAGLRQRLAYLAGLNEHFDLAIYGDDLWRKSFGERLRGKANYFDDTIVKVYNRHAVQVNISKFQLVSAINQRPFDVSACGGFVLTDERESLRELFAPDEVVAYRDMDELVELAGYYLENEAERRRMAQKARERVLAEHTYGHRMEEVFRRVG